VPRPPARFLTGNLLAHVVTMTLTASVGLMALFAVDFVNMLFIAMLGQAELVAAVGYAAAVLFFTTSFGIGMGVAAGALVARALGMGETAVARRQAATALIWGVLSGVAFAAIVFALLRPLATLLGATGATLDLTVHFLRIVVPSQPLIMVGMIGGAILRAHGDARRAMMATIWGGLVNALLDPLLIFGLGLGLTGAAVASVVARVVIAATALIPIFRHHGGLDRPGLPELALDLRPVMAIALPAILTQLAVPVGQAYVTAAMARYGEGAVAGMAIVGRMMPLAFGVIFALAGAVGPIIGQNAGAGLRARVRGAFDAALLFAAVFIAVVAAALYLLRGPLAALFNAEGVTRDLVFLFCGPLALAVFFNAAIFVANAAMNNLGRPFLSTFINWGRQTLGTIPFVLAGAAWWGAEGVLVGQAAGGVVFGLGAWVLALRVIARSGGR